MLQGSGSRDTPRYDTMDSMWEMVRGVLILGGLLLVIWAPILIVLLVLGWL
jgi:hypothetical protein